MAKCVAILLAVGLAACSSADDGASTTNTALAPNPDLQIMRTDAIPPPIRRLAEAVAPDIVIDQVEQKERADKLIYWHVRGEGDEVDSVSVDIRDDGGRLDRLGKLTAIAVTHPIEWAKVPETVRTAGNTMVNTFTPARVNQRRELVDGTMVYELFERGRARGLDEPSVELRVKDGKIRVVDRRRTF